MSLPVLLTAWNVQHSNFQHHHRMLLVHLGLGMPINQNLPLTMKPGVLLAFMKRKLRLDKHRCLLGHSSSFGFRRMLQYLTVTCFP
jgi:hypothetical protein